MHVEKGLSLGYFQDIFLNVIFSCTLCNVVPRMAAEKFRTAEYNPEEGIMAFYHRLTQYAARMVRPPNRYTFKRHFIVRLPVPVFQYLMNKEVTAEYSKMESILHHARRAEENARQMLRWYDE